MPREDLGRDYEFRPPAPRHTADGSIGATRSRLGVSATAQAWPSWRNAPSAAAAGFRPGERRPSGQGRSGDREARRACSRDCVRSRASASCTSRSSERPLTSDAGDPSLAKTSATSPAAERDRGVMRRLTESIVTGTIITPSSPRAHMAAHCVGYQSLPRTAHARALRKLMELGRAAPRSALIFGARLRTAEAAQARARRSRSRAALPRFGRRARPVPDRSTRTALRRPMMRG
jgi:hypothetical protein